MTEHSCRRNVHVPICNEYRDTFNHSHNVSRTLLVLMSPSRLTGNCKTRTVLERKSRRSQNSVYSRFSSLSVEVPILVFFLVLWFVCAHTGTSELFGPFRHCNLGAGVGVISAGLDVPSHCKIVAVVHGPSWLTCFACMSSLC